MDGPSSNPRPTISEARDARSVATVRELFEEYGRSIGIDLEFQGFVEELRSLPGAYSPPRGRLKLARYGTEIVGCAALRPRSRTVAEIKRLYVRDRFRGRGLGRRLTERVVADARRIGYRRIVLDTLSTMTVAIALYRSLGFVETLPYYNNPIPGARFFARSLVPKAPE
jgi:ribosomal protein S18 acetylase RimI-like enzyme